ncbi:MAG: response regulator [Chloroflexi bacterium]|nr:response regulator [Chloroflexota bacterium]
MTPSPPPAKKIMVVDDEPDIRDIVAAVLEDEGYSVVVASNGQQALEMLPAERPDLVVLDVMMPRMDGRELLRRMGEHPELARLPVIVMSAAARVDRVDSGAPKIAAFVAKPFDLEFMLGTIEQIVKREAPHDTR